MSDTPSSSFRYCPECGPASVPSHALEWWSVYADDAFRYLKKPPEFIWNGVRPLIRLARPGRLAPGIARMLQKFNIGTIIEAPDEKTTWRARVLWEEAERRGIIMREFRPFGYAREFFYAIHQHDTRGFDGLPRPRTAPEAALDWMDDKGILLKKLRKAGIPVPRGKSCSSFREAEAVFREINRDGSSVIVKPSVGSRSRHTYIGITDLPSLRTAFMSAKKLSPRAVVEEEIPGFVFRITLVNGEIGGIMRREPPHVMGDGVHTVRSLVEEENKNPLRHGPIFHEIALGNDAIATLKSQHLTLDSVPEEGRMVLLHPKVSRAFGASTTEITDIHPDNRALFLKLAHALDDPLFGADFMMTDMTRSWKEQTCGVIECNSLPFIDVHHFPLKGSVQNTAGLVWDMIFPESKPLHESHQK